MAATKATRTSTFSKMACSWLKSICLIVFIVFDAGSPVESRYRRCNVTSHIRVSVSRDGYCMDTNICREFSNCTTYYGNLIFRTSAAEIKGTGAIRPYFPHLREITGYLVIGLFNQHRFTILPALTVIRGHQLLGNYALVIFYCTELKEVDFSSLTTILHGGVRIEKNNNLCYVDGIKWSSIVRDELQGEQFGVVVRQDNPSCDTGCYSGRCKIVAGHGDDPNSQHCWGPGGNGTDYQCQKFCSIKCGLRGCEEGSTRRCCPRECLGGCADPSNVTTSLTSTVCYSCRHYRNETGVCVETCPKNMFLVNNLTCESSCPSSQYSKDKTCVESCPTGYKTVVDKKGRKCVKCDKLNPHLCPSEVEALRKKLVYRNNSVIAAYTHTNGHRLPSDDVKMLQMNVSEVMPIYNMQIPPTCLVRMDYRKCVNVTWSYNIDSQQASHFKNILFFTIYYRKLHPNERFPLWVGNDYVDTENWQSEDVDNPSLSLGLVLLGGRRKKGEMTKILTGLTPNGRYAFFVKEVTLGESRFSRIQVITLSSGIPTLPLGFQAAFLSNSSIRLKWKEPGEPNGKITRLTAAPKA